MKIDKITIEGFRAFNKPYEFTPGKRLTVILGPNGTGKTSFCDAVEWELLGKLPQYQTVEATLEDMIINRNNPNREAKVIISFSDGRQIQRSIKSKKVWRPTQAAKLEMLKGEEIKIVPDAFLATVYLRQEALREFIEAKPEKRRPVLSSLLGLEFIEALERGISEAEELIGKDKDILQTSLSEKQQERGRYNEEYNSLSSLKTSATNKWKLTQKQLEDQLKSSSIVSKAKDLYEKLKSIGGRVDLEVPIGFKEDLPTVSMFLEQLPEIRRIWRSGILEKLGQAETLAKKYEETKRKIEGCDENSINREIKEIGGKIKTKEEDLKVKDSFSRLLVSGEQYFGLTKPEKCPLCENKIADLSDVLNRIATKKSRLEEREEIETLCEEIRELEKGKSELEGKLSSLKEWRKEKEDIERKPDLQDYERTKKAEKSLEELWKDTELLIDIYNIFKKEQDFARRKLSSKEEIRDEEEKLKKLEHFCNSVHILCEQVQKIYPPFIQRRIKSLNPVINEYTSILSPHPAFSRISIAYNEQGYWLQGIGEKNEKTFVQTLFSTGQLNEVAVLVLLAMAKKAPHNLKFVILDDPSQSLDKDGKRRLAELLVKASEDKQMVVSTMDVEFADFIKSVYPQSKFFKFTGYRDEKGPVVEEC